MLTQLFSRKEEKSKSTIGLKEKARGTISGFGNTEIEKAKDLANMILRGVGIVRFDSRGEPYTDPEESVHLINDSTIKYPLIHFLNGKRGFSDVKFLYFVEEVFEKHEEFRNDQYSFERVVSTQYTTRHTDPTKEDRNVLYQDTLFYWFLIAAFRYHNRLKDKNGVSYTIYDVCQELGVKTLRQVILAGVEQWFLENNSRQDMMKLGASNEGTWGRFVMSVITYPYENKLPFERSAIVSESVVASLESFVNLWRYDPEFRKLPLEWQIECL